MTFRQRTCLSSEPANCRFRSKLTVEQRTLSLCLGVYYFCSHTLQGTALYPRPTTRRYTQNRASQKSRHFGRDAEIQAMDGRASRLCKCLIQVTCQPVVSCSRLQGHLSWPRVCSFPSSSLGMQYVKLRLPGSSQAGTCKANVARVFLLKACDCGGSLFIINASNRDRLAIIFKRVLKRCDSRAIHPHPEIR